MSPPIDYLAPEDDGDPIELTPAMIAACEDPDQLRAWLGGLDDLNEQIRAKITASALAGVQDAAWVWKASGKLGWIADGRSKLRRRLRQLGQDDGANPGGRELEKLQIVHAQLKASASIAHVFMEPARQQCPAHEFARMETQALATAAERDRVAAQRAEAKAASKDAYRAVMSGDRT